MRKKKWLLCGTHNSHRNIGNHLFNIEADSYEITSFCDTFDLTSLIKEPNCYKNPDNSSCIDLILPSKSLRFQNSCIVETGLSDSHQMILMSQK